MKFSAYERLVATASLACLATVPVAVSKTAYAQEQGQQTEQQAQGADPQGQATDNGVGEDLQGENTPAGAAENDTLLDEIVVQEPVQPEATPEPQWVDTRPQTRPQPRQRPRVVETPAPAPMRVVEVLPPPTRVELEDARQAELASGNHPAFAAGQSVGYLPPVDFNMGADPFGSPPKELPFTMNVIPEQFIQDLDPRRLRDIIDYTPGVVSREVNGGTGDLFLIRGFPSSNPALNGLKRFGFANGTRTLDNIERVEILKGPGGVEAGIVEPGGTINFVTKKPQAVARHEAYGSIGNYDRYHGYIDSTGPINDAGTLQYRFILSGSDEDSFRDTYDSKQLLLAPSVQWNYADESAVLFEFVYDHTDQPYDRGVFYLEDAGFEDNFAPISRSVHEPDDFLDSDRIRASLYADHKLTDVFSLRGAVDFNRDDYVSRGARNPNLRPLYIPGTNRFSGDPIVRRSFVAFDGEVQEFIAKGEALAEFSTGQLDHHFLAGVQMNDLQIDIAGQDGQTEWPLNVFNPIYGTEPIVIGSAANGVGRDFVLKQRDAYEAVFGQYKVDVWERLHLIGSLRHDWFDSREQFTRNVNTDRPGPVTKITEEVTSYRIGGAYDLTRNVTLFAGFSNSFQPQGGTDRAGNTFEPLQAENYEGGVKVSLFQDRGLLSVAYFDITQSNILEPEPNALPGENFRVAVGTVRAKGVELDFTGRVSETLELLFGFAYTDTEILENNRGQVGNRLFGVPYVQASVWGKYNFADFGWSKFSTGLGLVHVGERAGDNDNSFELPEYTRVDAALFYDWSEHKRFQLNVENLFDTTYYLGSQNRAENVTPGAPLQVSAGMRLVF